MPAAGSIKSVAEPSASCAASSAMVTTIRRERVWPAGMVTIVPPSWLLACMPCRVTAMSTSMSYAAALEATA